MTPGLTSFIGDPSATSAQHLHDNDGGNISVDEKKDEEEVDDGNGCNVGEEVTEGGEQLSQQLHEVQTEEQQHLAEEEANKIRLYEGTVTSEGTHLDLKLGAVHLTFPPDVVSEPTSIVVHKWKSSACSPQLQEHEAIVSNVIEISTTNNEALQFNVGVKLFLSHCAPDLQGYELVIKRLINKETNDWEEVEGTVDARQLSGVAVSVPKEAVSVESKFPLKLKVQEVPNDEFEDGNVYAYVIIPHTAEQVAVDPNFLSYLQYITRTPHITASFFAYFRPSDRIGSRDLLHLLCCPAHLNSQVKEDLDRVGVSPHEVYEITSRGGMIPGHDKAFVLVSGGISPENEEYMGEIYLMLGASCQHRNQLPIRLISDQEYSLVEFRNFAELRFRLPSRQMQCETSPGFRVKEGNPTKEELQVLAGKISENWRPLGRRLNFDEPELDGFDEAKSVLKEKAYAMLLHWTQRDGAEQATYQVLKEALCHDLVRRRDLAEKICCTKNSVSGQF